MYIHFPFFLTNNYWKNISIDYDEFFNNYKQIVENKDFENKESNNDNNN